MAKATCFTGREKRKFVWQQNNYCRFIDSSSQQRQGYNECLQHLKHIPNKIQIDMEVSTNSLLLLDLRRLEVHFPRTLRSLQEIGYKAQVIAPPGVPGPAYTLASYTRVAIDDDLAMQTLQPVGSFIWPDLPQDSLELTHVIALKYVVGICLIWGLKLRSYGNILQKR